MKGFKTIIAAVLIIVVGLITWATGAGGLLDTLHTSFGISVEGIAGILLTISGTAMAILRFITNTPFGMKDPNVK